MAHTSTRPSVVPVAAKLPLGSNAPLVTLPLLHANSLSSAARTYDDGARHSCSRPVALPLVSTVVPSVVSHGQMARSWPRGRQMVASWLSGTGLMDPP